MPDPVRTDSRRLSDHFTKILVMDVDAATGRFQDSDTQATRRDLVRAIFAAIEGMAWTYKELVVEGATAMDALTGAEAIALTERVHTVTAAGKVQEQERFIQLVPLVRLTTRIAIRINPTVSVDFGAPAWIRFKEALTVRHRITHPKSEADLAVSLDDVETCRAALDWLFNLALSAMAAVIAEQRNYLSQVNAIVEHLKSGDPGTWAEYRVAEAKLNSREE